MTRTQTQINTTHINTQTRTHKGQKHKGQKHTHTDTKGKLVQLEMKLLPLI